MAGGNWYYARGNQQYGPVDKYELMAKLQTGEVMGEDLVWTTGMAEWRPAREVPELQRGAAQATLEEGIPPPPAGYQPRSGQETPGIAIASLVLAALSWVMCGCLMSLPAVILGHQALRQIDQNPERYSGREIAMIALVVGYLNLALVGLVALFYLLIIVVGVASEAGSF